MANLEDNDVFAETRRNSGQRKEERPSTPAESQYSLDLAALELDSPSGVSTPLPQQHVDLVVSDDIDGPTDFTLNLGKWIRGGLSTKRTSNPDATLEGLGNSDPARLANPIVDLSNTVVTGTEGRAHKENDEDDTILTGSPSGRQVGTERTSDSNAKLDSPASEVQGSSATREFLQPTVEDYYSELSPARPSAIATGLIPQSGTRKFSSQTAEAEYETGTPPATESSRNAAFTDAITELKRSHAADRHGLLERMEQLQMEHRRELRVLEHDLELSRRSRDKAEASAKACKEALAEARRTHEVEMARSESEAQHSYTLQAQVDSLTEQLRIANVENGDLVAQVKAADTALSSVQVELSDLKRRRNNQPAQATTAYDSAVLESGTLRRQMAQLQQQLNDERDRHKADLKRVQDERQSMPNESSKQEQSLHEELEAKQSLLNDALIERDAIQDELKESQSKLDATQSTLHVLQIEVEAMQEDLSDLRAVNVMMDDRISDALRKREAYWRTRLADSDTERSIMAKALLKQWGEGELGLEEPLQRYVYRYAKQRKKSGKNGAVDT